MSILHFGHLASSFDHWLMGVPKPEYGVAPHEEVPIKRATIDGN